MSDQNIDSDALRDKLKNQGRVVDGDALHGKQVRVMTSNDILQIIKDILAKLGHKDNVELIAKITELEIRYAQARDKIVTLTQEMDRLKAELAKANTASSEQVVQLQADLDAIRLELTELRKIKIEYEALKAQLAAALAALEKSNSERDAVQSKLDELLAKLSERDQRILDLNKQLESADQGEIGALRKRIRELEKINAYLTEALIRAEFGLDYYTVEDKFNDAERTRAGQDPRAAKELAVLDARLKRMYDDEASIATIVELARAGRNVNAALERLGAKHKTIV